MDPEPQEEQPNEPDVGATISDDVDAPADEGGLLRELIVRAHPDIVPELLRGETTAELLASVPAAREAYARLRDRLAQPADTTTGPTIPTGATIRSAAMIDATSLSPAGKIRAGLGARS